MPMIRSASRRGRTPLLLATTSVAALLLGATAPALAADPLDNPAGRDVTSIVIGGAATGAVTNEGTIAPGMPVPIGGVVPTNALAIVLHSVIEGGITNSGTIMGISAAGTAVGINIHSSTVSGGITNNGTIIATGTNGVAFGIIADSTSTITGTGASNITNSGTIIASAGTFGAGIQLGAGGNTIVNTGTIFGSTAAIALDGVTPSTITQSAGALIGSETSSGGTDILNVTGGALSLQPNSVVVGFQAVNQSGGNVVLQVTPSTTAGQFPIVNVTNLSLSSLQLVPQSGSFAAGQTTTYSNVFTANGTLTNNTATSNIPVFGFFSGALSASLVPGTGPSQLSVTLTNNSGMALTPGVASGAGTFTTLTNPFGAILPAVSVTNGASVTGGIVNQGFIGNLKLPGPSKTGILVSNGSLSGPIVNTGTIAGTVSAIDVTGANGATTIMQEQGTISGAIKLSTHSDVLTIHGGVIQGDIVGAGTNDTVNIAPTNNANNTFTYGNTLSGVGATNIAANSTLGLTAHGVLNNNVGVLTLTPTSRITGNGTFTQGAAGTTALQFTNNTASGAFPTIAANAISLSGKLQVVLMGAFPSSGSQDFAKVFAASGTLTNNISAANVTLVPNGATFLADTVLTAKLVQNGNTADVVVQESPNQGNLSQSSVVMTQEVVGAIDTTYLNNAVAVHLSSPYASSAGIPTVPLQDPWGVAFGDWGQIRSDGNAATLSHALGGFVLGDDLAAFHLAGGDWRFGVSGGYLHDSFKVSQTLSSGTLESVVGGVYTGVKFGNLQLKAGAFYGTNTSATTRTVGVGNSAFAHFDGSTWDAFGEAGYLFAFAGPHLKALGISIAGFEPFAGAAAIKISNSTANEEGGTTPLTTFGKSFDVETTTLGLKTELTFAPQLPIFLKGELGWRHAYGKVTPSAFVAAQGSVQGANVASGIPLDRNTLVTEIGVNYWASATVRVGVSYSGQYSPRSYDNSFRANLHLDF